MNAPPTWRNDVPPGAEPVEFLRLMLRFGAAFVLFLVIRRLIIGPEAEGVFTLFGISFFLIGVILFGIGLLGEYIGRIYEQVRRRPRYIVQAVLESPPQPAARVVPEPRRTTQVGAR